VIPERQVRALFDEDTVTVYQAYSSEIADRALRAGRFVAPFKRERMTWIKPSFLWMMYRCGWATKPGQERVLAVSITRAGFEWALAHSSLSHYDPRVYASHQHWSDRKLASSVRIQWDPERSLRLDPLPHRSIQIGLSQEAVHRYIDAWITDITEVTDRATEIRQLVTAGRLDQAADRLPVEVPYPLSKDLRATVGAT
jgi:hypothetical protein